MMFYILKTATVTVLESYVEDFLYLNEDKPYPINCDKRNLSLEKL